METIKSLEFSELFIILCGIFMGTIARVITLKVDTRQNPSFPNGYFINLVMGCIAATLGSVAIPALLRGDFVAVTFLTLAIEHFRDIRRIERESLGKLEHTEYSKRGDAYIDGISKTYEARNYHSLLTAFFTVLMLKITTSSFYAENNYIVMGLIAALTGLVVIFLLASFTKGKRIGDICTITEGKMTVDHSDLYVDGMYVTNILGTERSREMVLNDGVAFVLTPKKEKFRLTLDNLGQRQAMLFEATRSFGVKRFKFTRRSFKEGKLIIAFVPIIKNPKGIMDVIKQTPVLENSRKISTMMTSNVLGGTNNG